MRRFSALDSPKVERLWLPVQISFLLCWHSILFWELAKISIKGRTAESTAELDQKRCECDGGQNELQSKQKKTESRSSALPSASSISKATQSATVRAPFLFMGEKNSDSFSRAWKVPDKGVFLHTLRMGQQPQESSRTWGALNCDTVTKDCFSIFWRGSSLCLSLIYSRRENVRQGPINHSAQQWRCRHDPFKAVCGRWKWMDRYLRLFFLPQCRNCLVWSFRLDAITPLWLPSR